MSIRLTEEFNVNFLHTPAGNMEEQERVCEIMVLKIHSE